MFDKLVESQKIKNGRKVGRYLTATAILYSTLLVILTIVTIVGYGPVLAEYDELLAILPIVPAKSVDSTPQMARQHKSSVASGGGGTFTPPTNITDVIANLPPDIKSPGPYVKSSMTLVGDPLSGTMGIHGGSDNADNTTPPPPPSTAKPASSPESKQGLTRVSEGVLQGGAIHKEKPAYPALPKQMRISGLVQIQVLISEDGRVIQAKALNGHALLQRAAEDAARKWVFSPTTLSKIPVKVQGVISFNFTLN